MSQDSWLQEGKSQLQGEVLVQVCAWCQQEGVGPRPAPNQSHGICLRHFEDFISALQALSDKQAVRLAHAST